MQTWKEFSFFFSDLLFTGGDPMVMTSRQLRKYIEPLIGGDPELDHLATIRIGSKSLAYWPYRYLTDKDSDDILRLEICFVGKTFPVSILY